MLNSSSNAARSRCEHLLRTSARPRTKPDESIRTNEHERADRCPLEPAHVTVLIIMLKNAVLFKFKYSSIVHSTVKHCLSQCDTYSLDTHASASPRQFRLCAAPLRAVARSHRLPQHRTPSCSYHSKRRRRTSIAITIATSSIAIMSNMQWERKRNSP